MNKIKTRHNYFAFLYLAAVVWMTFPMARVSLSRMPFFGYVVAILAMVLVTRRYFKEREFLVVGWYGLAVLLRFFMGSQAFPTLFSALYETFILLIPAILFYYFRKIDTNAPFVYTIIVFYTAIIIFESVMTYYIDQEYPGILRNLQAIRYDDIRDILIAQGLAPYSLPHALPTLMPGLILIIKDRTNKLLPRIVSLAFLIASLVIIWLSQATGPYLMTIFAVTLSLIVSPTSVKDNMKKLMFVSFFVLPFVLFPSFSGALLDGAKSFIPVDNDVYEKIIEIENNVEGEEGNGDIAFRGELLERTIQSIIENPIFGSPTKTYGNHNALIDRWAKLGLVGFIPLLIFLYLTISATYKVISERGRIYYVIGVMSALFMLLSKNQISWDQWFILFYFLPVLLILNYLSFGLKKHSKKIYERHVAQINKKL